MVSARAAAEELARRQAARDGADSLVSAIRAELFKQQLNFLDDKSRNKAALCTRRAGKTSMWSRAAVIECLTKPRSLVRLWAQTRLRVKELLWNEIRDVCARHKIKTHSHATELRVTFENGSEIRLVGADHDQQAQRKRGDKTTMEVVLECQSFGPFLERLVEEVIEPSTFDMLGQVCLEGTPGPIPGGFWFYVTGELPATQSQWVSKGVQITDGEDTSTKGSGWSCHRWSLLDNPHLPHAKAELERIKARKNWDEHNPTYLREYKAQWVLDSNSLYFKWSALRNSYSLNEKQPWGPGWTHVLGWDIGFNDAMALVVWGWHEHDNTLYEAATWSEAQVTSEAVVEQIRDFQKRFNIIRMVADTGGGGRLFVEEVQARYGLIFEAAKKTEKYTHVSLMNDDFLCGRIKTIQGSRLSTDLSMLQRDPDWDPLSGKPPESDRASHAYSHTCESALYSWRYAQQYLAEKAPAAKPMPGSQEYADMIVSADEALFGAERDPDEWWTDDT